MLSQHDFLTPEECNRSCEIIHSLKEHWVNRGGGFVPFYTLGAASYLDADESDPEKYVQKVEKYNPILTSNFPLLYERLTETLSAVLEMPVSYAEGMGLPGFHIFLASKVFENPIASVHFDVQFKTLKWKYDQVDLNNPISFTCVLSQPSSGSGLNYWNIAHEEAKDLSKKQLEDLKEQRGNLYFSYELGKLVLHRGLILHQIAASKELRPNDERITLQGHGVVADGMMRLYW